MFNGLNNDKQSAQIMLDRTFVDLFLKKVISWNMKNCSLKHTIKNCIICQIENKNILHCVQTLQMGDKMFSVVQKLSNKGFYGRLNVISAVNDAPANDVMYHSTCWVMLKQR